MAKPIDSIWDDSFQIPVDPLLGSDSFISSDTPIQTPEQTEQKAPVSDPIPSSQPDSIGGGDVANELPKGSDPVIGPDPLLGSDAFITEAPVVGSPEAKREPGSDPLLGSDAFIAADTGVEGAGLQTPVGKRGKSAKRSRKGTEETENRPSWLPENWTVTCKTRTSGATAGTKDRYYVEPTSGQRFRSKIEVQRYLETGSKKKPSCDANAMPSDAPGKDKEKSGTKTKKSGPKKKKEAPWTFDFQNPPEEVTWTLNNQGLWKPSIGDEEVPETTALEWATTFKRVSEMP